MAAVTIPSERKPPVEFQSLFWWIGDGGLLRAVKGGRVTPGVSILVLVDWRWRQSSPDDGELFVLVFQSLFWWIGDGGT